MSASSGKAAAVRLTRGTDHAEGVGDTFMLPAVLGAPGEPATKECTLMTHQSSLSTTPVSNPRPRTNELVELSYLKAAFEY